MNTETLLPTKAEKAAPKAEDIKHKNRLSDDQIAAIDPALVFQWVKTGKWSHKDFKKWLHALRVID